MKKTDGVLAPEARSDSPWGLSDRAGCAGDSWQAPSGTGQPFALARDMAAGRPLALTLALVVLAGLCLGLVHWGACPLPAAIPKSAEFNLQASHSSFKLNTTSAGAPGSSSPALPSDHSKQQRVFKAPTGQEPPLAKADPLFQEGPEPKKAEETAPAANLVLPPESAEPAKAAPAKKDMIEPPALPLPLPAVEAEPVVPVAAAELAPMCSYALYVVHQGDVPMTRTWKTFGLQTVLAAALTAAPATTFEAQGQEKIVDNKELAKRIADLDKQINTLKSSVKGINEALLDVEAMKTSIKRLEEQTAKIDKGLKEAMGNVKEDMDKVLKALDDLKDKKKNGSGTAENGDDVKARLDRIEKILDRLGPNARIRRYPPPGEMGRILLTNNYADEEMTFVINGVSYRLAPGASRLLDAMPAGPFSYEVVSPTWGVRARKPAATLVANETFRLTVD